MNDGRGRHVALNGRHLKTRGRHIGEPIQGDGEGRSARHLTHEQTSRSDGETRSRGRPRRALLVSALCASFLVVGVVAFADGGTLDVKVADKTGYAKAQTTDGAIVEYIGEDNVSFGSSGSGVFEAFLRTHASPSEQGYNTDGAFEFDEVGGAFTHSILVSEIPVVECVSVDGLTTEAGLCWELFADVNDSNSTPLLQLTDLEIYFSSTGSPTGYPAIGTKVYDFQGVVQINDVNPGSGRGDLRYLVPLDGITLPADCDYGSGTCTTYFVLYTGWGDPTDGEYSTDAGFNEWKVKRYPFLSVEKTATTTFTRTFSWTIDKSVVPETWALFDGDTGTSDWTVTVDKTGFVDSDWAVSGSITVSNPSEEDATLESITDSISGIGGVPVVCGLTVDGYVLEPGDELVCTYESDLPDGTNRTNTATATLDTSQVFTGEADVIFGAPTTLVNDTIDVTDTNGMAWNDIADDDSFTYAETFACGADEGTHNNTATITQTGQFDGASVTVTCYDLDVTKTANPSFSRDFDWTITKSVDPDSLDLFDGDSDSVEWTVEWTKGPAEDFGYAVSGSITIDNNHPSLVADLTGVTDSISGVGAVAVNCPALVVPAGGNLVCTYESDLPDGATRTNSATATQQNYDYASDGTPTADGTTDYSGDASVDFTGVNPTVTDDTATITDDRGPLNQLESTSGSTSYTEEFTCDEDEGTHDNTAVVTETDSGDFDDDDASVTVNCYQLTVTKDADTSFDRDYDWTIDKTRVFAPGEEDGDGDPTTLNLDPDQVYTLTYEITVDLDVPPYTDSNWAVEGTITVNNPAPIAAEGVAVSDIISGYGTPDNLDCDPGAGVSTIVDIPANSSVDCEYSSSLPDGTNRTNTATATLFGIGYDSSAVTVDFSTAVISEIDECITVVDDNGTPGDTGDDVTLGTVCADDPLPHTFTHTIEVGPFGGDACGLNEFTNTSSYTTDDDENDTDETGSDPYTVIIDVRCPEGCTLTPGYWKTHNASFWGGAPEDPNWFLLGDIDGDGTSEGELEEFFDTGMTWFDVLWENPAGRPYYQLAFQYAAAYLNKLSIEAEGGFIPSHVQDALDDAAVLLDEYDGSEAGKNPDIKGKDAKDIRAEFVSLAGVLGSFNEGGEGIPHCDEDGSSAQLGLVLVPFLLLGGEILRRRRGRHQR